MGYWADQERVREATAGYERKGGTATWECDGATSHGVGSESLHQMSTNGRNPRSVLRASPEPYKGAHYAVFPSSLIAPLIRASCPTKCCPICGAGWIPVVERDSYTIPVEDRHGRPSHVGQPPQQSGWFWQEPESRVIDYQASCECGYVAVDEYGPGWYQHDPIPGTVLDPFVGSGTTLAVAAELGLDAIGIDLSSEYLDAHAKPRIGLTPSDALDGLPLFAELEETL